MWKMCFHKAMWLADLHVHSNFSDGKLSIPELVDFYGQRDFGCIAITDHVCEEQSLYGKAAKYLSQCLTLDRFPLYQAIMKSEIQRAKKEYNMLVLPGFELSKNSISNHRSAHILAIGVENYFSADGSISSLLNKARAQSCLTIAAHPVSTRKLEHQTYYLWDRREEMRSQFDAWEVASGPHFFEEVANSGLSMIATSDFHRPEQINSWKTAFDCPRTKENVFQAVREQNLEFTFYREEKVERLTRFQSYSMDLLKRHDVLGHVAHLRKI